jgi:hypothetical protein
MTMQGMDDEPYATDIERALEQARRAAARGSGQWPNGRTNAALRRARERRKCRMLALGALTFLVIWLFGMWILP